ncbi:hypothetical protein R1sor_006208 [Riccia sorocarpa]|uniref:Uncharacterized protein n=1 Tax=Riccia sorocarpa TaxID=122646 RepID=A0ABD3HPQ0_9MARC
MADAKRGSCFGGGTAISTTLNIWFGSWSERDGRENLSSQKVKQRVGKLTTEEQEEEEGGGGGGGKGDAEVINLRSKLKRKASLVVRDEWFRRFVRCLNVRSGFMLRVEKLIGMIGMLRSGSCVCEPNANPFVQNWFSDCVYTPWELAAFYIGLSSVLFWIVAQLPQFISNIKNQSAEALSPWFLFQWLTGDSFNLLGCILTGDQLATETLTATYFIFADCIIISQYIFYSIRAKEKLVFEEEEKEAEDLVVKAITDYQRPSRDDLTEFKTRLAKMTIVIPESEEDWRHKYETGTHVQDQHANLLAAVHHHHPVTFVAGRSGAAMIAHAIHSPLCADHSPDADYGKRISATPTERERVKLRLSSRGEKIAFEAQTCVTMCLSREEWIRWLKKRMEVSRFSGLPQLECQRLFSSKRGMQRHKRSVLNRYGLESGPPTASRLTIHHTSSLRKHELERAKSRLGPNKEGQRSRFPLHPVKAVVCLAGLIAAGASINIFMNRRQSKTSGSRIKGYRRSLRFRAQDDTTPGLGGSNLIQSWLGKTDNVLCGESTRSPWVRSVGVWLGWGSSGFYLGSRVSQIALNTRRQSADGLSLAMLACAACANSCMGISILMRSQSWSELLSKAPWVLGSLGTVSLDIFLVAQAKYFEYRKQLSRREQSDVRVPLLV